MANSQKRMADGPRKAKRLHFGCWNMRTLMETDGTIATSVAREGGRGVAVDRKPHVWSRSLGNLG